MTSLKPSRFLLPMSRIQGFCLFLFFVILKSNAQSEIKFLVEGETSYELFNTGKRIYATSNAFRAVLTSCDWIIRSSPTIKEERNFTEMSCTNGELKMLYSFDVVRGEVHTNILAAKVEDN